MTIDNLDLIKRIIHCILMITTTDARLNSMMTLHVHKEETDKLDLARIANLFCSRSTNRLQIFGHFTSADVAVKGKSFTKACQTNERKFS